MPSALIGNISGGLNILSGAIWSGQGYQFPVGGVQLKSHPISSGIIYIALSGNITTQSGGPLGVSGQYLSGLMDGIPMSPGEGYFVPRLGTGVGFNSGNPTIYAITEATVSGRCRLCWEVY